MLSENSIVASIKEKIASDKFAMAIFILISIVTLTFVYYKNTDWMEIDSYALPMISIQYRGSIICNQEDIEQAKIDFPTIYSGVNTYDDFRSSKLIKIDEDNWYACYFPIYAFICMPVKLALQLFGLNQERCFAITAALLLLLAVYMYLKLEKEERNPILKYIAVGFMLFTPIWFYMAYIGIEPVAYSLVFIAILLWRNRHYRIAAFIISFLCTSNPAIMGCGIAIFFDYFVTKVVIYKKEIFSKQNIFDVIKLCCCYIPALIPFAINYMLFGELYPAFAATGVEDTLLERALAYIFDFNLGVNSFAPILVILFFVAIIWAIYNRKYGILKYALAFLFMDILCSSMIHINSGMLYCARYEMWMYPALAITVYDFMCEVDKNRKKLAVFLAASSILVTSIFVLYNAYRPYIYMSRVSEFILDNFPELYISMCNSTFTSRVNHTDLGTDYNYEGYAIYCDSRSNEVRKIQYRNIDEVKQELLSVLESIGTPQNELYYVESNLKDSDGKIHYLSINPNNDIQYRVVIN